MAVPRPSNLDRTRCRMECREKLRSMPWNEVEGFTSPPARAPAAVLAGRWAAIPAFIHSFIHTRFQLSTVGLLCRHGPASAPVAEVRVTAFGNSHFTSSLCSDQQPPPLDGLAPIYDYLHRRLKECFT